MTILLSDIFEDLAVGPLAHTSAGSIDTGVVPASHYKALISAVNHGLTDLHTRFLLRKESLVIKQDVTVTDYILAKNYTVSAGAAPIKWIQDTVSDPFVDNYLIQIEQAFDADDVELSINDEADTVRPLYVDRYNVLTIPDPVQDELMTVKYRAKHPHIPTNTADASTVTIELPPQYREHLITYVAMLHFDGMDSEGSNAEAQRLLMKYNGMCGQATDRGMTVQDNDVNVRFERNGWV